MSPISPEQLTRQESLERLAQLADLWNIKWNDILVAQHGWALHESGSKYMVTMLYVRTTASPPATWMEFEWDDTCPVRGRMLPEDEDLPDGVRWEGSLPINPLNNLENKHE